MQPTQPKELALELLDTKRRIKRIYCYNEAIIKQIKNKEHVFWDDNPDVMQDASPRKDRQQLKTLCK
jgi:hypothetical protein